MIPFKVTIPPHSYHSSHTSEMYNFPQTPRALAPAPTLNAATMGIEIEDVIYVTAKTSGQPSREQWIQHRAEITLLYSRMDLPQLSKTMVELHDFNAS